MPASSPAESTLAGAVQLSTQQQGKTFLNVLQETHTPRSHLPAPRALFATRWTPAPVAAADSTPDEGVSCPHPLSPGEQGHQHRVSREPGRKPERPGPHPSKGLSELPMAS